jgi:hypothetical protein
MLNAVIKGKIWSKFINQIKGSGGSIGITKLFVNKNILSNIIIEDCKFN